MSRKVRVTAARGLNVRERPTVWSRRVGALPSGAVVSVVREEGTWGAILAPLVGWIHLGYTEPVDEPQDAYWLDDEAIDLSRWNRVEPLFWRAQRPWATVVKATQGINILDPCFGERWARLRFQGWRRWAYHFYDPAYGGKTQAVVFLRVTGLQGDERAVLDLEWYPPKGERTWAAGEVRRWIDLVERATGKPPVIYTRRDVWVAYFGEDGDSEISARCPLWVADYRQVGEPLAVPGWDRVAMWQYTSRGRWPGVAGNVDRNRVARWFAEQEMD